MKNRAGKEMPLSKCLRILLGAAVFLSGCEANESMNVAGNLIYAGGGGSINLIDFSSPGYGISSLYKSEGISAINHLTKENSGAILFGECSVMGECSIKQYSMKTGRVRVLRSGRLPSFMPNHEKLFFYDRLAGGDKWLFVASLDDINNATKISEEPGWNTLPNGIKEPIIEPVIQISNDEILFVGKAGELQLYNVLSAEVSSMGINDCRPMSWRSVSNQLLCEDWDTFDIFLLDIKTRDTVDMPELKGGYGFVYVPGLDALFYSKTVSSFIVIEGYDMFFYQFSDKKEKRIKKNVSLSAGVWME